MSEDFRVGDEVVCVDDSPPLYPKCGGGRWIKRGEHYSVNGLKLMDGGTALGKPGVFLAQFEADQVMLASRFRKVNPKAIEIFKQMCADAPKLATKKASTK